MPATIINQNWYDQNSDRAYPLMDGVTRLDASGTYTLPNGLIVDLRISAPLALDPTKFFISRIQAIGSGVLITVAVDGVADVATVVVPSAGFAEFQPYQLAGLPGYLEIQGVVVFGGSAAVLAAGIADFTFTLAATRIVPTLVLPLQAGVTSLTIQDSFGGQIAMTGPVVLTAGSNATVSAAGQTVTVGMNTGVLFGDPCATTDPGGLGRAAIRSINGVTPDPSGNIALTPVGCPSITAVGAGLVLTDRCAEPCCGDAEMQNVAQNINDLDKFLATLANQVAQLESSTRIVESWLVQ